MSGSLLQQLQESVLSYIGMITNGVSAPSFGNVKIIGGGDVLGHFPTDFTSGCHVVQSPWALSSQSIHTCIEQNPSHAVHVMVALKVNALHFIQDE